MNHKLADIWSHATIVY
jgi:hypothetical protein